MASLVTLLAALLLPQATFGQEPEASDPWEPLRFLVGAWEGHETGAAGVGRGERTYELVIGGEFLHWRNISRFEPQPANPEGEVHEDWGIFSYDSVRETYVLRQFFIEGFVHQYVAETFDPENGRFVFVSESIEGIVPGWRSRYSIAVSSEDAFVETLELAAPGEELFQLLENHWTRVQH